MPTASKKEIVLAVANKTGRPSAEASAVCQSFLDPFMNTWDVLPRNRPTDH